MWRCFCGQRVAPRFDRKKHRPYISCTCGVRAFLNHPQAVGGMLAFTALVDELEATETGAWARAAGEHTLRTVNNRRPAPATAEAQVEEIKT